MANENDKPEVATKAASPEELLTRIGKVKTLPEALKMESELGKTQLAAVRSLGAAQAREKEALPEIEAGLERGRGRLLTQAEQKEKQQKQEAEAAMSKFQVSRDTVGGMAALSALITVIGQVAGKTGGKQAALGSIQAMTGMMEGFNRGRADEFKRNQIEFDRNFKIMQSKIEEASREFDRAVQMMPYNMAEANKIANTAKARLSSDIITQQAEVQGITVAAQTLKDTVAAMQKAEDRANQLKIAETKAAAKGSDLRQKLGQDITKRNDFRNNVIPALQKSIPVVERLIKDGQWGEFTVTLGIDPRVAEANYANDREVLELIRTLSLFRSAEFATAGANLTKMENAILSPLYRGDFRVGNAVLNAMQEGLRETIASRARDERAYPLLKELNEVEGYEAPVKFTPATPAGPGTPAAAPAAPAAPKPMPTGDKLKEYADKHFAGDQEKAKNFLKTQGYQ